MANAFTNADALCFYLTGLETDSYDYSHDYSIGGVRLAKEVDDGGYLVSNPIPQIIVQRILGSNGAGTGTITVKSSSTVSYTAPGDTEGATVTLSNGSSLCLQSNTVSKAIRVTRDGSADLQAPGPGVGMSLNMQYPYNNAIGMSNVTNAQRVAGVTTYRGLIVRNESALAVTSLQMWINPLSAVSPTSSVAQLGATGSGTITTAGSFATWPAAGFVDIATNVPALREICYYTSRTNTSLTIPAAGRALLGTTSSAGAATDTLYAVPGLRVTALFEGADNSIERIANENTAPVATWFSDRTYAKLSVSAPATVAGGSFGIWLWRQVPAGATVDISVRNSIAYSFIYNGVTYTGQLNGLYRVANTTLEGYELYVGTGANPDLTSAPATTSATLPFTYALTPPGAGTREYRYTVLYRNRYNLTSLNQYWRSITIDSTGANVTPAITPPTGTALIDKISGYAQISALYNTALDSSPADTWAVYVTTTGVDPNPAIDTPTLTSMTQTMNGAGFAITTYSIAATGANVVGPYTWGADLRILVRARRSSDSVESANTTPLTLTVGTTAPARPNKYVNWLNTAAQQVATPVAVTSVYYIDTPNSIRITMFNGESIFYGGSSEIWRLTMLDATRGALFIPSAWALIQDATAWGAGTATAYGIEVASWGGGANVLYVIVNGTRRVKIDVTNQTISANSFTLPATLTDCPMNAPTVSTATETLFQVWNETLGRNVAGISVTSTGIFKTAVGVVQKRGN